MKKRLDLTQEYHKLLKRYGHQKWWPVSSYSSNPDFEICVGAILTQNTSWKNVERAITSMHAQQLMTPKAVATCLTRALQRCIRSAGYYRQKAKKLKLFSQWLIKNYKGDFKKFCKLNATDCRLRLLALWGIGPETADSMLLYAGKQPSFVIDAYTKRWLACYEIKFKTYDEYQQFFMRQLPLRVKLYNEYHALIVAWGKTYSRRVFVRGSKM